MIQRLQSVFLLFVAILMLTTLVAPLWHKTSPDSLTVARLDTQGLTVTDLSHVGSAPTLLQSTIALSGLCLVTAGIAIFSLASFKKRVLQMQLGFLNTLLIAGTAVYMFYISMMVGEPAILPLDKEGVRDWGYYLPLLALFSNFVANRLIRRDEQLVRSMDRLR
jgi:hypothetical protein